MKAVGQFGLLCQLCLLFGLHLCLARFRVANAFFMPPAFLFEPRLECGSMLLGGFPALLGLGQRTLQVLGPFTRDTAFSLELYLQRGYLFFGGPAVSLCIGQ